MSAFVWAANTAEVALTAATAKTVLQVVAPANHRVRLLSWGVYFDGTTGGNEPVVVRLLRQTTAGTMSALTPVKVDDSIAETIQCTAQHTATVEPTAGDVLKRIEVHPQSYYEEKLGYGEDVIIGGGDRLGIECNAPNNVNVVAHIKAEE